MVGQFQTTIAHIVALAVLMPIVAGMGGNAGTQVLALVVRGLALGQLGASNVQVLIWKEVRVAALNGLVLGLVLGLIVWAWFGEWPLALVIASALTINLLMAALAGVLVPVTLKRMGFDPALAGGVILTTVTDVMGFPELPSASRRWSCCTERAHAGLASNIRYRRETHGIRLTVRPLMKISSSFKEIAKQLRGLRSGPHQLIGLISPAGMLLRASSTENFLCRFRPKSCTTFMMRIYESKILTTKKTQDEMIAGVISDLGRVSSPSTSRALQLHPQERWIGVAALVALVIFFAWLCSSDAANIHSSRTQLRGLGPTGTASGGPGLTQALCCIGETSRTIGKSLLCPTFPPGEQR